MSVENQTQAKRFLSRRSFIRAALYSVAGSSLAALGGTIYATRIETNLGLGVGRVQVAIPGLSPAFDGFRLVQLTDFHFSDPYSYKIGARAIRMAQALSPDLFVLTGDFVTDKLNLPAASAILSGLSAPHGVWAILGNHDHWFDSAAVRRLLVEARIAELRNTSIAIQREGQRFWLAGVDDIWEQQHDLDAALSGTIGGEPVILLAHEPDYADEAASTGRVALQLSGHSHGGQVVIPGYGPYQLPHLGQKYWQRGIHQAGGMLLHVSAGVGSLFTLRLNCPPEVTEITLRAA